MDSSMQDQINTLATRHGLDPSPLEVGRDNRTRLFLCRDVPGTRIYGMALVSYADGARSGPVKAFCGLYGADRKVADDGEIEYQEIEAAIVKVAERFDVLAKAYRPGPP